MYVTYVTEKYGQCTVVFDGYSGGASTRDNVHKRRIGGHMGMEVKVEGDMLMNTKKIKFLGNSKNKQNFIHLLSSKLLLAGVNTCHAEADADLLIVITAVESAQTQNTILVGDDTDLLILLCSYAKDLPFKIYMRPEPKVQSKQPKTWNIEATRSGLGDDIYNNILRGGKDTAIWITKKITNMKYLYECQVSWKLFPSHRSTSTVLDVDITNTTSSTVYMQ
ncbi:hypothetical protein ScPMuIL_002690 [Solemya velum]